MSPAKRAAIGLVVESNRRGSDRAILKFRSLFIEGSWADWGDERLNVFSKTEMFVLHDYFENEKGEEITMAEIGRIMTGDNNTILVPNRTKQYIINYLFAEKLPVPVAEVTLSTDEIRLLGYFVRDFEELRDSAVMKVGPGQISTSGELPALPNDGYHHQTAVTDDEIRSFVTIFRRLYMEGEPANFKKATDLFERELIAHPLGQLVKDVASEYQKRLEEKPELLPLMQGATITFNTKRLVDIFLYTQYAHQPNEKRQRQFKECLQQVGGNLNFLTWLFLKETWMCSIEICNAGQLIAEWFKHYCAYNGVIPNVLNSLRNEHKGLGTLEKDDARDARLFREKVQELELELWRQNGEPAGGPQQFHMIAEQQLKQAIDASEGM
jgi:hypothetical protein